MAHTIPPLSTWRPHKSDALSSEGVIPYLYEQPLVRAADRQERAVGGLEDRSHVVQAKRLLARDVQVRRRIGHADSRATAQVHEHCVPKAQKATAARFQSLLTNARSQAS